MAVYIQLFRKKEIKLKSIKNTVHFTQDTFALNTGQSQYLSISFIECFVETVQFYMMQTPEMKISQNVC